MASGVHVEHRRTPSDASETHKQENDLHYTFIAL